MPYMYLTSVFSFYCHLPTKLIMRQDSLGSGWLPAPTEQFPMGNPAFNVIMYDTDIYSVISYCGSILQKWVCSNLGTGFSDHLHPCLCEYVYISHTHTTLPVTCPYQRAKITSCETTYNSGTMIAPCSEDEKSHLWSSFTVSD